MSSYALANDLFSLSDVIPMAAHATPPHELPCVVWVLDADEDRRESVVGPLAMRGHDTRALASIDDARVLGAEGQSCGVVVVEAGLLLLDPAGALEILRRALPAAGVVALVDDAQAERLAATALGEPILMLAKPAAPGLLVWMVARADEAARQRARSTRLEEQLWEAVRTTYLGGVATHSDAMRAALRLAEGALRHQTPVLITGESGTGKRGLAWAIHVATRRHAGDFVDVATAPLPVASLDVLVARAGGGTFYLEDVGELSLEDQDALLGHLRESSTPGVLPHAPRWIGATRQDPVALLRHGRLREELYYRLGGRTIPLPPLRRRPEDIPDLFRHFASTAAGRPLAPSDEAVAVLLAHAWPGNVTELQAVAAHVAQQSPHELVDRATVVRALEGNRAQVARLHVAAQTAARAEAPVRQPRCLDDMCREEILYALAYHDWNVGDAARSLRMGRATLYKYIGRHGLMELRPKA